MKVLRFSAAMTVMFLFVMGLPLMAAEYKPGELIVKFRSQSLVSARVIGETEQRAAVIAVDDTRQALADLQQRPDVEYAEPNYLVEAESVPGDWGYTATQWTDVGLPQAWDFIEDRGPGSEVVVAVIDSGVDLDHPELEDILLDGYDFANSDNNPDDDYGHGTRVAGIIGAKANNAFCYAGVAWNVNVRIMPLKFLQRDGRGYISDAISAIYYAVDQGADIINASWGFDSYSSALEDAIDYARANGVLFICSAGNSGENNDEVAHYPSNYTTENVIAVAAMNQYGDLASWSNYGYYSVDLAAPGQGLKTTDNDGGPYSYASGTSYAAPFVSAIAAMVIAQFPELGYQEVRERLVMTSVMDEGYTEVLLESGGCVNASNALANESLHSIPDKREWNAPSSQNADANTLAAASGGGSDGGTCYIDTASTPSATGVLFLIGLMVALFPMRQRQE